MNYLFIDTSSDVLSIAIISNDKVSSVINYSAMKEHSKYAMAGLKELFSKVDLKPEKIDKIFVVNGPGSFTGIRIGLTIAKIYAFVLNVDVVPVSSLKALALSYSDYNYYIPVISTGKDYMYAAVYDDKYNNILEESYIDINKLEEFVYSLNGKCIIIGNCNIEGFDKLINPKLNIINIIKYYENVKPINIHLLKANYIKKIEVEQK